MNVRAAGFGALATTACVWCAPGPAPHLPVVARAFGIRRRLALAGVALTFDDGPDPRTTPAVLALLAEAGVHATFFLVGEQVERFPEIAAQIASAGHEIGVHGYRHRPLLLRSPWNLASDLERAEAVIGEATGSEPRFYRAPYGVFSSGALVLAARRSWTPLLWSRWGREWHRGETPETVAARAAGSLEPGDVVLLHDGGRYGPAGFAELTVRALPGILERIRERGLPALTASGWGALPSAAVFRREAAETREIASG
jgi:peptidoglycan/xylan/chitin deacetylase (PgdA/CDA1 family)